MWQAMQGTGAAIGFRRQGWGAFPGFDARALWSAWAPDPTHRTVGRGHCTAEEAPGRITAELRGLPAR